MTSNIQCKPWLLGSRPWVDKYCKLTQGLSYWKVEATALIPCIRTHPNTSISSVGIGAVVDCYTLSLKMYIHTSLSTQIE